MESILTNQQIINRAFWTLVEEDRTPIIGIIFQLSQFYTVSIDEVFESIH